MKKIMLLFLALFLTVTLAQAAWVKRTTKLSFNDCPAQLDVVGYGCNYVTSGDNQGKAFAYVNVKAKDSVMLGCAYFKVYGPTGNLIFKIKRRIKVFAGSTENVYATVPPEAIGGATEISAEVGVGCDCNKPGY